MKDVDGYFERYREAAGRRQAAANTFLRLAQAYQADVKRNGREIASELLEGFFEGKYAKNTRVRKAAQDTKELLGDFDKTAALVMPSVMTISMQLNLALDTLALQAIAASIRDLATPLDPEGKTPLEIAREGVESLSAARQTLHSSIIYAVTDANLLETQVEETLLHASLLLEVRRKRLWDFRRENLSVTWKELRERATKEGQHAASETIRGKLKEIITDALEEEFEDISQLRRAHRYIRLFHRLFGRRQVDRRKNDTDQMMDLLDQLERENELLTELHEVFERAGASIDSIRARAEKGFEERPIV